MSRERFASFAQKLRVIRSNDSPQFKYLNSSESFACDGQSACRSAYEMRRTRRISFILKMEERLIVAVCCYPELYDTSSYFYQNRNKKEHAWRNVSEEVGLSEEQCRKKWKSLRDTYLKERRKDTERRSGSAAGAAKKWKYSVVLSFLDPFVTPKETSGNMAQGVEDTAEYDHQEEAAAGQSEHEEGGLFTSPCSFPKLLWQ
ncbi:transcription factor Adf-1-like [Notolabrus celidotus]|uniref:transcription factor Adf-1-like n=1 Tax=Notolabrus celidotus TaxID=1203425 RepID=UPI00148FCFF6|nr:transcription factor Adf-1-like [Notolabrus celidotus]